MKQVVKLDVVFYEEFSGKAPVIVWLRTLTKEERVIIGGDIATVQFWPVGMPLVRSLSEGLWEIRSKLDNKIARTIFFIYNGKLVMLHGFIKKTQKTPRGELDIAKKRQKNVLGKNYDKE